MLRFNGVERCCSSGGRGGSRKLSSLLGWFLPSALLLAIPKCPLCVVAYTAAITGLGISVSTATGIRVSLITSSLCLLAFVLVRSLFRVRRAAAIRKPIDGFGRFL